jgi:hypothetical protein
MAGSIILDNVRLLDEVASPTRLGDIQRNGLLLQYFDTSAKNVVLLSNTTPLTAGSIAFSDANGNLVESNANLFWDNTSKRLGILTATPGATLDIASKFQVNSTGNLVKVNNVAYSWPAAQGAASTFLQNDGAGNLSWAATAATLWNTIGNPTGNQALTMAAFTTTWTWNATTGAGVNLFNLTDTAANTGTGYLVNIATAAGSALKPLHVMADAVDAITVIANGNVGIRSTAPSQAFDVATKFLVDSNGNILKINNVAYSWPAAQAAGSGYVLSNDGSGNLSWVDSTTLSVKWNDIASPNGNQALTMAADTTTWTWNATTGAGVNLFNLTDTAANTGTGYLANIQTAAGSALKPLFVGTSTVNSIVVLANGRVGIATATPGAFALDVGGALNAQGNLTVAGGNLLVTGVTDVQSSIITSSGAALNTFTITELVTVAASAFTDSTTNLLPANSLIIAVSYRVITASTGAASFDLGVAGDTNRYAAALTNSIGSNGSSFSLAIPLNPSMQKAAAKIRVTPNATPGAADGTIRIVTTYQTITPPTA